MLPDACYGDEIPPGAGIIEVRLAELSQLFHTIDPSPFREKDLDPNAEEFIVSSAKELPADKPLALVVHLDKPAVTPEVVSTLRDAIHNYFRTRSEQSRKRVRQLFRIGKVSLVIGLLFLAACLVGSEQVVRIWPQSPLARVLAESLLIGGWVAMWRPLQIFLYDWWPIRSERRLYERLSEMAVQIACAVRDRNSADASDAEGRRGR